MSAVHAFRSRQTGSARRRSQQRRAAQRARINLNPSLAASTKNALGAEKPHIGIFWGNTGLRLEKRLASHCKHWGKSLLASNRSYGATHFPITFKYDNADRLTEQTYPSGRILTLGYDTIGQISSATLKNNAADTNPKNVISGITYQPFGPVKGYTYGNGLTLNRDFDLDGQMTNQSIGNIQTLGYSFDVVGNIINIQDAQNAANDNAYLYDDLDRLIDSQAENTGHKQYQYDPVGNRTSLQQDEDAAEIYEYQEAANRIDTKGGMAYTYDAMGNTLTDGVNTYTYNDRGRLHTVSRNGQAVGIYKYNAAGERVEKVANGITTHFVYDIDGTLLGEYQNGQAIREYIYVNEERVALVTNESLHYVHNDHLGTARKIADESKQVVWAADYTPFGKAIITTEIIENPTRFPGQYFDAESGLHQNGYRIYDPDTGRYVTSDPVGLTADLNTYAYVDGNPILLIDPEGLSSMFFARPPVVTRIPQPRSSENGAQYLQRLQQFRQQQQKNWKENIPVNPNPVKPKITPAKESWFGLLARFLKAARKFDDLFSLPPLGVDPTPRYGLGCDKNTPPPDDEVFKECYRLGLCA